MSARVQIPYTEVEFSAVRSGGPGGQHVNKTASAVVLKWNVVQSLSITPEDKAKLLARLANRISGEGFLSVRCESSRDQLSNKKECWDKLLDLVNNALIDPKPRKKTKPTKSSQRRRLQGKKMHSDKKRHRGEKF